MPHDTPLFALLRLMLERITVDDCETASSELVDIELADVVDNSLIEFPDFNMLHVL
jgi:hypothetical protein